MCCGACYPCEDCAAPMCFHDDGYCTSAAALLSAREDFVDAHGEHHSGDCVDATCLEGSARTRACVAVAARRTKVRGAARLISIQTAQGPTREMMVPVFANQFAYDNDPINGWEGWERAQLPQ